MIKNKKLLSIEKDFVKNGYYIFDTNEEGLSKHAFMNPQS